MLLVAGELDITFAMLPLPDGPFAVEEIFCDEFVLLVGNGSTLADRGTVSLGELAEVPLITPLTCRSPSRIDAQLSARGINPNIVHRSDDNGTVNGLVAEGAGVAVVPRLSAGPEDPAVRMLELEDALPLRRNVLCWRTDRRAAAAQEAFVAEVRVTCRQLGLVDDAATRRSAA